MMLRVQLNTKLYQKMYAEQERYKDWLLMQSPEKVLENAEAYIKRESILQAVESCTLNPKQAQLLLKEEFPLSSVYSKLEGWEVSAAKQAWKAVEARANELVMHECSIRRER